MVAAQDVEGTWWWLLDTGSERLVGPMSDVVRDAVTAAYESFVPAPGDWVT